MNNILNESLYNHSKFTRILEIINSIEDPRRTNQHPFASIMILIIYAHIAGKYGGIGIAAFANNRVDWFKNLIPLPFGVPSHDTFTRLINKIHPEEMTKLFEIAHQEQLSFSHNDNLTIEKALKNHICIDGKDVNALVLVKAYCPHKKQVLNQVKVSSKSNEITAIPKLLDKLRNKITGAIITIDAIGTQRKIVKQIIDFRAHYLLAVKGNQHQLHADIKLFLDDIADGKMSEVKHTYFETTDKGHGRIEKRRCWTTNNIKWLHNKWRWKNLQSISLVEAEIIKNGSTTITRRYYISDLPMHAEIILALVRDHWGIENSLHWPLNNSFREDTSTIRKGRGAENASIFRCVALSLLQQHSDTLSIATKCDRAGCVPEYLLEILLNEKIICHKPRPPSKSIVSCFCRCIEIFIKYLF